MILGPAVGPVDGDVIRYWQQQSQNTNLFFAVVTDAGPNRRLLDSLMGVATGFATGSRFATVITMALPQQPLGSYWESLLLFATGRPCSGPGPGVHWRLELDHDHDECGSDGSRGRAAQRH